MQPLRTAAVTSLAVVLLVGCISPQTSVPSPVGAGDAPRTAGPKRITAAVMSNPSSLSDIINTTGPGGARGIDVVESLINAGMVVPDNRDLLQPQLAEAVPTIENGLWSVLPDGRMETTWTIRPNAEWHDGVPFATDDLLFAATVVQDRELVVFRNRGMESVERLDAPDARTIVVKWRRPYIYADTMFTRRFAFPMPRHLLERPYTEDKANFTQHPFWAEEYVGTGPFKLRELVRDSHLVLAANERYVLGRPRIDEVEVKFIPDRNALMAGILASAVDLTVGGNLSLEEATQVRDQWRDGDMLVEPASWVLVSGQQINPGPAVVADARFRRALVHALDRQQMVDTLMLGQSSVAHSVVSPAAPEYQDIEPSIVRYDYDPRRAVQLIEELGYVRTPVGSFRDATNRQLAFEITSNAEFDIQLKSLFSTADYWQRIGLEVEAVVTPQQRLRDAAFRASYPGFSLQRQPNTNDRLVRFHSSQAPLPENNFTGDNKSRYMNAELDALLDHFFTAIPRRERTAVLGQIVHHLTDQLPGFGLFYDVHPLLAHRRIANVAVTNTDWNAHRWEIR